MSSLPPPPPAPTPGPPAEPETTQADPGGLSTSPPPPTGPPTEPAMIVPDDAMVVARNVSKWFKDLVAVSDVSFTVSPGVTALLGPNGAGKSTMLRMLCGLAAPSNGTIEVLGRNPRTDPSAASNIGLAPQQESVFETLTAHEFVTLSARLQGLDAPADAAAHALHIVELDPTDRRRLPTYSKGMRQRVKLAQAIVHEPEVIMLDEPLTGLDPRQRLHMVDLFHRLGDEGRCVIVSSHVLEEVERFGSNILVIAKGRLAAQGDFRAIRDLIDDRPRRIRVRTDRPQLLAGALVASGTVSGVRMEDDQVEIDTHDARALAAALAPLARRESARLLEVRALDEDLESVFRYLVERR
jgi:ABC-2 type transport system ATP-binding protein